MREVGIEIPQANRDGSGPRLPGLADFLAVWRIGECSWQLTLVIIVLRSVGTAIMAGLLFVIRNLVELKEELTDTRSLIVIASACGLLLTHQMVAFAADIIGVRYGLRVFQALRQKIFSHLLHVPLPILEKQPVGEWIARCENDTRAIQGGLLTAPRTLTYVPLAIIMYSIAIFWQSPAMGTIILLGLLVGVLPAVLLRHRLFRLSQQILQRASNLTGRLSETFMSIKTVKCLCAEAKEEEAVRNWIESHSRLSQKAQVIGTAARQLSGVAMGACFFAVALYGRHRIIQGALSLGELVATLTGIVLLSRELQKAATAITSMQTLSAATKRYLETLALPTEPGEADAPRELPSPLPDLTFHQVSFAYEEGMPLLRNLDFSVRRGEILAVVGLSGTGKSTLIDMIAGFRQPGRGQIRVAGCDIHSYDLAQWRRRVGVVLQQPRLFSGTIRQNLLDDDSPVTTGQLWESLKDVYLDEMLRSRSGGENAQVRETGSNWSEGEVQRLALLRALFRKPEILLLDEPTSALDARSEQAVVRLLRRHASERITLVITHRMALAVQADQVVVIGRDRVEGLGAPRTLYEQCPLFRYMCLAQYVVPDDDLNGTIERSYDFAEGECRSAQERR
ncbi:MAG: ABC transporter ATP-binding protein [Sedimentisphaerales bacterium]|nr:ABC transporter ATP-binding protein [Sedimentisphaerales bacterium]